MPSQFHLAPCLNANPHWIDVMTALVHDNAGGWAAESVQNLDEMDFVPDRA